MTCIAAVVRDGKSWVGGDSCVSEKRGRVDECPPKVFRAGPFVVGFAGDTDYCHMLLYRLTWPRLVPEALDRFMAIDLPDHAREVCRRVGLDVPDGAAVVAVTGRLWTFDGLDADGVPGSYTAVGSGAQVALGALCATEGVRMPPSRRVQLALEASARHRTDVAGPFTIIAG